MFTERERDHLDHPLTAKRERRYLRVGFAVGCLVGLIILIGAVTAVGSLQNCHAIQRLYTVAQLQGERALKTLPTIAYYKTHPAELKIELALTHRQIRDFKPPSCSLPS